MKEEKNKTVGKNIFTIIITVIVTLIVLVCIIFAWVLIKNPLNVRGIILYKIGWVSEPVKLMPGTNQAVNSDNKANDEIDVNKTGTAPVELGIPSAPATQPIPMTETQRQAVEDFGIDPDSVIITPAMEDCFIEKLGEERVNKIIHGATPGALEMFKASSCL